ncbi:MAG: ABC transporter substrate-binding protein [Streptosporangiales bacterium]|nr:ABC transporter substrate-binding protein [Streptosporangiales bacterium]
MRRVSAAVAATALLVAAAFGCAPTKEEATSGETADDSMTIATTSDVVNFNPLIGNSRTDAWITDLMYPRMLSIGADGQTQAALATKWGYKSPTTGYWEIRDDMKWSDGEALTANDVAYTINAIKKDKPAGVIYGQMANVKSASAVSKTRVEIELTRPDATVVPEIGFWMNVVPQHVFEKAGSVAKFANASDWVSAGPYRLTKVNKGQSYTFKRVEPYPLAKGDTPTLERIVFRVIPDVNSEILALKNGDVDVIANTLPPAQVKNLSKASGVKVQKVPGLGYAHMTYNMEREPLDDVKVRQALAHTVDYKAIRKVVLQNQGVSTGSCPIPPVLKQYENPDCEEYSYDIAEAKKLLREAGYGPGGKSLDLTLIYALQDPVTAQWASIVKSGATKAGITIKLRGMDRNTYLSKTDAGEYDIYAGNFAIMDDPPTNMTLTYLPDGAINYSKVDDPKLSALIRKAQATTDEEQQVELIGEASTRVRENVYDNVMYTQNLYVAHRSNWTGFTVQPSELLSIVNPESLANVKATG